MERRRRAGAGRHRKDDAIADARDLAVADERPAVLQEDAEQRRVGVARRASAKPPRISRLESIRTPANVLVFMEFQA